MQVLNTLWPMPGGSGTYLDGTATLLRLVRGSDRTDEVVDQLLEAFPTVSSTKAARSYLRVLDSLGLVEMNGATVALTQEGRRFLRSADSRIIEKALLTRIAGCDELLSLLRKEPRRIGLLIPAMQGLGYSWQGPSQIRYRLRWLEEVGLVDKVGRARPQYFVIRAPRTRRVKAGI